MYPLVSISQFHTRNINNVSIFDRMLLVDRLPCNSSMTQRPFVIVRREPPA